MTAGGSSRFEHIPLLPVWQFLLRDTKWQGFWEPPSWGLDEVQGPICACMGCMAKVFVVLMGNLEAQSPSLPWVLREHKLACTSWCSSPWRPPWYIDWCYWCRNGIIPGTSLKQVVALTNPQFPKLCVFLSTVSKQWTTLSLPTRVPDFPK